MGFRFRKSIKICPGIRLNISKSGVSTTLGGKGASLNLGSKGVTSTIGIPGTGLSYSKRLIGGASSYSSGNANLPIPHSILIDDKGKAYFTDSNGCIYDESVSKKLKQIYKTEIEQAIIEKQEEVNALTDKILEIHKNLFKPKNWSQEFVTKPFVSTPFNETLPDRYSVQVEIEQEIKKQNGFFKSLFSSNNTEIQQKTDIEYDRRLNEYNQRKQAHINAENRRATIYQSEEQKRIEGIRRLLNGDVNSMEDILSSELSKLDFPLDTNISFSVIDNHTIFLDVDLPEIEDIPLEKATITASGKLSVKQKSQKELRQIYATVVCGIAVKISSFVFSILPTCDTLIISGYTQRLDKTIGHIKDTYIYSFEIDKNKFYSVNFNNADVIMAMNNFEPLMNLNGNYEFKEIAPYDCGV